MNILNCFKPSKEECSFDLLPDGIFTLEQDGKIVNVNKRVLEIYNKNKFDILGHYFSDFVQDGTAILNEVVKSGISFPVSAIIEDDETPPILLELSASRHIETGKVFACVRDISNQKKEQKVIAEKYSTAQKIISEKNFFLVESSGAILSNLVSIAGFSRALLDGIGGALSEKQMRYLKIINANSKDLNYDLEKLFTLFKLESGKIKLNNRVFDLISLIKSIDRIYKKELSDKKIVFSLDFSTLTQRDCYLDSEIVEYILKCIMDIFVRFANFGKCSLNIGHPPEEFLKNREFRANMTYDPERYVLFEAKIADLIFAQDELENIFDMYYRGSNKRPIGLKATLNLLKIYIQEFGGDIWIYSKQNFGTMFTFVLPLR